MILLDLFNGLFRMLYGHRTQGLSIKVSTPMYYQHCHSLQQHSPDQKNMLLPTYFKYPTMSSFLR